MLKQNLRLQSTGRRRRERGRVVESHKCSENRSLRRKKVGWWIQNEFLVAAQI